MENNKFCGGSDYVDNCCLFMCSFLVKFEYRYFISKEKFSKLMSPL